MQKFGLLALAISASVWADTSTPEKPVADKSIFSALVSSPKADHSGVSAIDVELGKRVYFYKYLTDDYLAAITDPETEPSLAETEVLMTIPASFLNMGMDSYALSMIGDSALVRRGGLGNSWFMLAQRAAEQSNWEQAFDFSSRAMEATGLLDPDSYQENRYILATSLANQDLIVTAEATLVDMDRNDRWYFYALYNVMLAKMRGAVSLDDLSDLMRPVLKMDSLAGYDRALRDRFLLTAGQYALDSKDYPNAVSYLRQVSNDGPFTADALLQYGWALSRQWLYDQALQPWRVLQDNFYHLDLSVLESLMATPYVAELMHGGVESLHVYEYAERHMTTAMRDIDALHNDELLSEWVNSWAGSEKTKANAHRQSNWLESDPELVRTDDTARALRSLLNTPEFLTAQQQLLDLHKMSDWVVSQKDNVTRWQRDMNDVDADKYSDVISGLRIKLADLKAQKEKTKRWIETEERTPFPYATEPELDTLRALDALNNETRAATIPIEGHEALNRKAGILFGLKTWNIAKQRPVRRWNTVKAYLQLGNQVNDLDEKLHNVMQLSQQINQHHNSSDAHIASFEQMIGQLDELKVQLDDLKNRQQTHVVILAGEHLDMLSSRLKDYLATTRLSIARLYDNELRSNTDSGGLGNYE